LRVRRGFAACRKRSAVNACTISAAAPRHTLREHIAAPTLSLGSGARFGRCSGVQPAGATCSLPRCRARSRTTRPSARPGCAPRRESRWRRGPCAQAPCPLLG
jgi:hypothetical protein